MSFISASSNNADGASDHGFMLSASMVDRLNKDELKDVSTDLVPIVNSNMLSLISCERIDQRTESSDCCPSSKSEEIRLEGPCQWRI
jgi:hypothetical protein